MSDTIETLDLINNQLPKIHVKCIEFNDGTKYELTPGSIVIFTGANNSGKSQVLRDIESYIKDPTVPTVIVKDVELEYSGVLDFKYFKSKARLSDDGYYWFGGSRDFYEGWKNKWENRNLYFLASLFVNRLDTEERLIASKAKPLYSGNLSETINPMQKLHFSNSIEDEISKLFYEGFGQDLIVNRRFGSNVSLHIGKRPEWPGGREGEGLYYEAVGNMPMIDKQGDGIRSFTSILIDTFTSDTSITLIDEPEAFLHPPQARIIGRILAKNNPNQRQLFIATHSSDFINGLLEGNNQNVVIIRINRNDNINHMYSLDNIKIHKLWKNPILRYSNILNGLFHKKVIVCESDYDCLFYKAMIDEVYEDSPETVLDIMFTHSGGKDRMKDIVSALKALRVSVIAIPDFDILNDKRKLIQLTASYGIKEEINSKLDAIYGYLNANNGKIRDLIKDNGYSILKGAAYNKYQELDQLFRSYGLFIVPVGEIECFDKSITSNKKDWVYSVIERGDLGNHEQLEDARNFVKKIVSYTEKFD